MLPEAENKMTPREGTGSPGHGGRLSKLAKRYAQGAVEQLKIWHERQSLERELGKLDDASLSDLSLTRAQISTFVSA